ncbi:MAG: ribosome-associated translation inhibitor RaiA [Chlamydiales bacterium]|jgi:putative sigma-54 modulation protein|nr:ribosome-associated translation inhibitor RaiA [Chlamydiales bacterium]
MNDKNKFEQDLGYRVDIIGRQVQVTDSIKNYIWNKLFKIERLHNHILHLHVTLEVHKVEHICVLMVKLDHLKIKAKATSTDMYFSIDQAMNRLHTLICRYKDKIRDHYQKVSSTVDMEVDIFKRSEIDQINTEIEEENREREIQALLPPMIIDTKVKPLKTLNIEEALMKIDLSQDRFLIFRSEEDQKLKVLYRRKDGHYGLIRPE